MDFGAVIDAIVDFFEGLTAEDADISALFTTLMDVISSAFGFSTSYEAE